LGQSELSLGMLLLELAIIIIIRIIRIIIIGKQIIIKVIMMMMTVMWLSQQNKIFFRIPPITVERILIYLIYLI
jgi:hypothetical protein